MKIKEVNCGIMGIATDIIITVLPFATDADECQTHYKITNANGEEIKQGNYWLTKEQFAEWANNNEFVENCVLSHLGLERA